MNLAVDLIPIGVFAVIAGGGNNYDTGVNKRASGPTNRIIFVGIDGRSAQAHVHHANAVLIFVQRIAGADRLGRIGGSQNPIERTQQGRHRTSTVLVQHAQADDVGVRRNAQIRIAACRADSGSSSGHVTTMSVWIVRGVVFAREVFAELDAARGKQRGVVKRGVSAVDT